MIISIKQNFQYYHGDETLFLKQPGSLNNYNLPPLYKTEMFAAYLFIKIKKLAGIL